MNPRKTYNSKIDKNFIFFCLAAHGSGISGSDRIFIELARRWKEKNSITLHVFPDGYSMCQKHNLTKDQVQFSVHSLKIFAHMGFVIEYMSKILYGIFLGLTIKIPNPQNTICYSSSEFWMDSFPTTILKLRYPKLTWVASWYQTAPNPFVGFASGKRENVYRFRSLLYYVVQLPVKVLIKHVADFVIVNNEDEKKQFPDLSKKGKVIVLIGAVNLRIIDSYKKKFVNVSKKYDAVFQGRFHPQKGVVELVEIWGKVVQEQKNAKLIMIGDGPLKGDVDRKIASLGLQANIVVTGYMFDGEEKYKIFAESKIAVHPSFYDSGGMASAEVMAFGIPCVGFDLPAFESYYPEGMVKVPIGDMDQFAEAILHLLQNDKKRSDIGKEAEKMIYKNYSWDTRAKNLLEKIV